VTIAAPTRHREITAHPNGVGRIVIAGGLSGDPDGDRQGGSA
jgi:hypothetical protein